MTTTEPAQPPDARNPQATSSESGAIITANSGGTNIAITGTINGNIAVNGPLEVALRPCTLPRDPRAFIGRADELQTLIARSAEPEQTAPRIYVIDGMAGVGKTTVAVHAAHRLAPNFPDGQLFLKLHAHTEGRRPLSPAAALRLLLQAWGFESTTIPRSFDARLSLWRRCTAGKQVLLILDDALDFAQVDPLIPGSRTCLVLITSRTRITITAEADRLPLPVMSMQDAAELFFRLSGRSGPSDTVAPITQACGYLPLAISLLAARLRQHPHRTVAALVAELELARQGFASMRTEDAVIAATIELSVRELTERQRLLYQRLGLHPGTVYERYAAAALTGTSNLDIVDDLDVLCERSLLDEPHEDNRYEFHTLIRSHARSLTSAGDGEALQRLFRHYAVAATQADGDLARHIPPSHGVPADALPDLSTDTLADRWWRAEHGNLIDCVTYAATHDLNQEAVTLAAILHGFLRHHGYWTSAARIQQLAAAAAHRCHDARAEAAATTRLGAIQRSLGDYAAAAATLTAAARVARDAEDRLGLADALLEAAALNQVSGHYSQARADLDESGSLYHAENNETGVAATLTQRGALEYLDGNYRQSETSLQAAFTVFQQTGDHVRQAHVLTQIGAQRRHTGDVTGAIEALKHAVDLYESRDIRPGLANAWLNLGGVYYQNADLAAATHAYREALDLYVQLGNLIGRTSTLVNIGAMYHLTGDLPRAVDALTEALATARHIGAPLPEAEALTNLGPVLHDQGETTEALCRLDRALELFEDLGDLPGMLEVLTHIGDIRHETDHPHLAAASLEQAMTLFHAVDDPALRAGALNLSGRLCLARDDVAGALADHDAALAQARMASNPVVEADAHEGFGRAHLAAGNRADGLNHLRIALAIHQRTGVISRRDIAVLLTPPA